MIERELVIARVGDRRLHEPGWERVRVRLDRASLRALLRSAGAYTVADALAGPRAPARLPRRGLEEAVLEGLRAGELVLLRRVPLGGAAWVPPPREDEPPETVFDEPPAEEMPFEIQFVDELGAPIDSSFSVEFAHDGETEVVATDGQGVARLVRPGGSTHATVRLASRADAHAVADALRPRWDQAPRVTDRLDEVLEPGDDVEVVFHRFAPEGEVPEGEAPPPTGAWKSELEDRGFRVPHRRRRVVSVQPYVVRARLLEMFFDTNKCFLLPSAIPLMRRVRELYDDNAWTDLLVVGHTDRSGDPSINDPLSLQRAQSVAAYLRDDVDAWLAHYGADRPWHQRWGTREDHLMIGSLAEAELGTANAMGGAPVLWYQRWHNALPGDRRAPSHEALAEDGAIGPLTRRQLVGDYMNRDRTTLPEDVELTVHGCGESFPLDPDGDVEQTPEGPDQDPRDRRVELYFFDRVLGIEPPPPGEISAAGSAQYPEWRARARRTWDLRLGAGGQRAMRPPSWFSYRRSFPKPSLFGALRQIARHMEDHPLSHLVIVGHTDTLGEDGDNHALSLARAEAVRSLLCGDADDLMARFDRPDPHDAWSWEELQWLLHGVRVAGEPAYVGAADGVLGPATRMALGVFQQSEPTLPVLYDSDRATVERLVGRYVETALGDVATPGSSRVECVGAGSWHAPRPFGPLPIDFDADADGILPFAAVGRRRVELFLFDVAPSPAAEEFPSEPGGSPPVYDTWCDQVQEELTPPELRCWIQTVTSDYRPVSRSVSLERVDVPSPAGASLATSAAGFGSAALPLGAYRASVSGGEGTERHGVYHYPDETCGSLVVVALPDAAAIADGADS